MTISGKVEAACYVCGKRLEYYAKGNLVRVEQTLHSCPKCENEAHKPTLVIPDTLTIVYWENGEPVFKNL